MKMTLYFYIKELFVNFDPQVQELLKETAYIKKMNLEIPESAKDLITLEPKIEGYVAR